MKQTFAAVATIAILSVPVAATANSYSESFDRLESFLKQNQIGSGRDVWLAKTGFGTFDPVAVFFGYYDDLEACRDAARGLNLAFPSAGYVCTYIDGE